MSVDDQINLETLARAVDAGTDRLREHLERFEGGFDRETGEIIVGVRLLFETAIADEANAIVEKYEQEGKRPPGEDIRNTRAAAIVKRRDPELYGQYHALKGSIETGQRWLSGKKASLSALQTLNKTGVDLAGAGR